MLQYFIRKAIGKALFFKPRVIICVPSGITNVERRAVMEAARKAGARKTVVMEEPLAAAIGAGLDIAESNGSMVIDIGGGTTDVAILSLSGIVISESLRIGSNTFDEAIIHYLEKIKHITIGSRTAEELKILIGTALPDGRSLTPCPTAAALRRTSAAAVRKRACPSSWTSIPRKYAGLWTSPYSGFCGSSCPFWKRRRLSWRRILPTTASS